MFTSTTDVKTLLDETISEMGLYEEIPRSTYRRVLNETIGRLYGELVREEREVLCSPDVDGAVPISSMSMPSDNAPLREEDILGIHKGSQVIHYLPPSRFIDLDEEPAAALKAVMEKRRIPYLECTTWTTDGFYRETADMVAYRMEEGCRVVEMECATLAAVARFRGKKFGQLLYCGDLLVPGQKYDDRNWSDQITAREKLFNICLEALLTL